MQFQTHTEIRGRSSNQDRFLTLEKDDCWLAAVSDGHGDEGGLVADAAINTLKTAGFPSEDEDPMEWIKGVHQKVRENTDDFVSGATLSIFYSIRGRGFTYQIGDSPIFAEVEDGIVYEEGHNLTNPHNKDAEGAVERGGFVMAMRGTPYLWCAMNGLQMTRALGNRHFGDILCRDPDIFEVKGYKTVLVASDGYSGCPMEFEDLVAAKSGVECFVKDQIELRRSSDNLTMVLVYL